MYILTLTDQQFDILKRRLSGDTDFTASEYNALEQFAIVLRMSVPVQCDIGRDLEREIEQLVIERDNLQSQLDNLEKLNNL